MLKKTCKAVLILVAAVVLAGTDSFAMAKKPGNKPVELKLALEHLWADRIFMIRAFVISTKDGKLEAAVAADEKVIKNARGIADSIAAVYGTDASNKFFDLLAGHYGAIKDYMTASFSNDGDAKKLALDKLDTNAGAITDFLGSANPYLPKGTVSALVMANVGHHVAQIDAVNAGNFASELGIWQDMERNIYLIADVLADAIARQFPDKFEAA